MQHLRSCPTKDAEERAAAITCLSEAGGPLDNALFAFEMSPDWIKHVVCKQCMQRRAHIKEAHPRVEVAL